MHWLVKINLSEFEIWTEARYAMMIQKCEYYGAKPFWQEIRKLELRPSTRNHRWEPGEIVPYAKIGRFEKYAVITELLKYKGTSSFKGFDIFSRIPVLSPIPNFTEALEFGNQLSDDLI